MTFISQHCSSGELRMGTAFDGLSSERYSGLA
jgi:hypothetical protein